jgi:hypothetical protein
MRILLTFICKSLKPSSSTVFAFYREKNSLNFQVSRQNPGKIRIWRQKFPARTFELSNFSAKNFKISWHNPQILEFSARISRLNHPDFEIWRQNPRKFKLSAKNFPLKSSKFQILAPKIVKISRQNTQNSNSAAKISRRNHYIFENLNLAPKCFTRIFSNLAPKMFKFSATVWRQNPSNSNLTPRIFLFSAPKRLTLSNFGAKILQIQIWRQNGPPFFKIWRRFQSNFKLPGAESEQDNVQTLGTQLDNALHFAGYRSGQCHHHIRPHSLIIRLKTKTGRLVVSSQPRRHGHRHNTLGRFRYATHANCFKQENFRFSRKCYVTMHREGANGATHDSRTSRNSRQTFHSSRPAANFRQFANSFNKNMQMRTKLFSFGPIIDDVVTGRNVKNDSTSDQVGPL